MYTVVIPIAGGRGLDAAAYAAALPDSEDAVEAVVLNVFEEFEVADEAGVVRSADLYDESEIPPEVQEAAAFLGERGVDVTVRREHGDPLEEILRVAEAVDADTIAVTARRRSPTGKAVFGSTTQQLILESDRPVTVLTGE